MTTFRQPGPLGHTDHDPMPILPMVHVAPPEKSDEPVTPPAPQPGSSPYKDPTFLDAVQDKEFWRGYGESVLELGKQTGYMLLGEASVYAGWALSRVPGGAIAGNYMMVDGTSTYLGAMCNVSKIYHGPAVQCVADDFVGEAYRSASKFYTGDESYGDVARASVSIAAVIRGNTIPLLLEKYKGSALHHWVTVPGYKASNRVLIFADGVTILDGVKVAASKTNSKD